MVIMQEITCLVRHSVYYMMIQRKKYGYMVGGENEW